MSNENLRKRLRAGLVRTGRVILGCVGPRNRERLHWLLVDALEISTPPAKVEIDVIETPRGRIHMCALNGLASWRASTLLSKEPETIEWIDSFGKSDVFWDIGANIGVYSLYAAIDRNVRVISFEPGAGNYALLNKNIELNRLGERVTALCVALSDQRGVGTLNMSTTEPGGALSNYGEAVDHEGNPFDPVFKQGALSWTIDLLIADENLAFPNHLKIDVDGIESKILKGGRSTLRDSRMQSVMIGVDESRIDELEAITQELSAAGFELASKRHAPMFDDGPFKSLFNCEYRRALATQ